MPVGMARRALNDYPDCGDAIGCWTAPGRTLICIVDGLGHGTEAAIAAEAALHYVGTHASEPIGRIFSGCDETLRPTRGAAMGVALIDEGSGRMEYAAVGNISAMMSGNPDRYLPSTPGVVGGGYRRLLIESVVLQPGELALFWTDGLKSRIDLSRYGRASRANLTTFAERLLREWSRGMDDAALVLFRKDANDGES